MTVAVVGNAVLDTSFEVARLPHPGESLLARSIREDLGGKGLNQAVAAARAGATVLLRASIGDDAAGRLVHEQLLAEGIDTDFLLPTTGNTDRTTVFALPDGENAIVTSAERSRSLTALEASEAIAGLGVGDVLLIQGNLSQGTTQACAELAARQGLKVVLNPSPITFDYAALWPYVDVIVLNEHECATLSDRSDPRAGAQDLIAAGAGAVVVTRGPDDVLVAEGTTIRKVEVARASVVDTTGAGDVFCGVLAAGIAAGMDLIESCHWSVAGAAIAVTRRGAIGASPTAGELAAWRPGVPRG
jgi:ribokinase